MDAIEMRDAFDGVFDQAVLFHGFTDYMRDMRWSSTFPAPLLLRGSLQPVGHLLSASTTTRSALRMATWNRNGLRVDPPAEGRWV